MYLSDSSQAVPSLVATVLDHSAIATLVLKAIPDTAQPGTTFLIELANQQAQTLLALTSSNEIPVSAEPVLPSWLSQPLHQPAIQAVETGQPTQVDVAYSDPATHSSGWLTAYIQPVSNESCLVVNLIDVTSTKQAALASQQDARFFQTLATNLPEVGVLVVDKEGIVNRASGLMPGLLTHHQPQDLRGQPLVEQIMVDYQPDWERYLTTALTGESHFFSDHWNAWRCECFVGPIPSSTGGVDGVLVVFRNVTEAYRQQQALLAMNQALLQSNERLESLAYMASHDLQEPLRKLQLYSDLIREGANNRLNAQEQDLLNRMQAASQRMNELIESLLSLAQLKEASSQGTLVDLADLLSTLVGDLSVSIQERSATIELIPPLPMIVGAEPQLRQLFQNLFTNALKFTKPEVAPRIRLQARLVDKETIPDLSLPADRPYVEVSVADNGIGIDAQHIDSIFGMFTRLHGRHEYKGIGLGLALVKQVVDNHQGRVRVESQVGVGTVIHVYLPVAPGVEVSVS